MSRTNTRTDAFEAMTPYLYIGMTDSVRACDCCGRDDLKQTMALYDAVLGEEVYFGTTCGARALKMPVKAMKAEINAIERRRIEEDRLAREAKREAEMPFYEAFHAWACKAANVICAARAWSKLGGMQAARDAYRAQGGVLPE